MKSRSRNKHNKGDKRSEKETILIVEDDTSLREGLSMNLEYHGYKVLSAATGDQGMQMAFDAKPDLIILDLMLPGLGGLDILGELRARSEFVPVLILSARDAIRDKIEGLGLGADDYVTKPFELPELIARIQAMLRRQRQTEQTQPPISFGEVVIDRAARSVTLSGKPIAMSAKEYDLLCLLAQAPGRPITRQDILDRIWGWDFSGSERTVNNFILNLRQKLEADPAKPRHIITVRQVGYKLVI